MRSKLFLSIAILCCISLFASAQTQTGTASFYADKFNGRKTSSGEVFSQKKMTCAHKTLPFGTELFVRNLSNDSTVVVTVNDRLPQSSKRIVDLSKAAAAQLNFIPKGLTKVELVVLQRAIKEMAPNEEEQANTLPVDSISPEKKP
jgi:rare lipoprotein A